MIKYTELKATDRHNLRDVLPLRKPFTVLVEPSSLCNFRCVQCFQSMKTDSYFSRNRMHMPLARFQRVIEQLREWEGPRLKVLKLSLYGEPLLNPVFCEMLRIAKEAKIAERIETTTNASLLSRAIAEALVQHQLDYARVSIYATDQEQHKATTASSMDIRTIHENLRGVQEVKRQTRSAKPFISCKMLDAYSEENERFLRMYQDVADEAFIEKPHSWIKIPGADFICNYYKEGGGAVRSDLAAGSTRRVACPMAFTTMAIRSNGDVSPCCVDFIGGTNLGNIDDRSLKTLWHSDEWYAFMKMQLENRKHENSSCARCDFYSSNYYIKDDIDGFDVRKLR